MPAHPPPDQPVKTQPAAGVALSVTAVPAAKVAVQLDPQSIPLGVLVTVPRAGPRHRELDRPGRDREFVRADVRRRALGPRRALEVVGHGGERHAPASRAGEVALRW